MNYTPKDYRQRFSASKEEKIKSKNWCSIVNF